MAKAVTYYDLAENDYQFLKRDYEEGRVGNIMCYASQNVCERYFKHLIDCYCKDEDTTSALRTHSLKAIRRYLSSGLPDFKCDWTIALKAEGYYYSARYPGEESFIVDKEDVDDCWEAVEETRRSVMEYIASKMPKQEDITKDKDVIKKLENF